jgi:outer membrane protein assembly factor BamB
MTWITVGLACALTATLGGESRAIGLDPLPGSAAASLTFAPGDLLVSLRTGQVQWWHADGTPNGMLVNAVPGKAEGMGFDAAGNLYVSHYCADATLCTAGNMVEKFSPNGTSLGAFGSGYNCNPYSFAFDRGGRIYVGQGDCTGDIRVFDASGAFLTAYDVAPDIRGSARVDLAADGCTMFYTSQGPNVKRFDICANRQLPDFNVAPIPSGYTGSLRVLPDGGVLVAFSDAIARLDASGRLVRTYDAAGEPDLWIGLDLVGDGTFWASNYGSSDLVRFDLATGAVLAGFNAGTPTTTVKDVLVRH